MAANVYEMITDRIIEALENGIIPWEKPWTGSKNGAYNLITKKPYSLLNQMLLNKPGAWASFKQITDKGGKVKKGEKSSICVFWKMVPVEIELDNGETEKKVIPYLRYYNVFHVATQTEGIEVKEEEIELSDIQPVEAAEELFHNYLNRECIELFQELSDNAFYQPSTDSIHLPKMDQFHDISEYYSTAFHESTHSTGHAKRLNRLEGGRFGSKSYSKEELVAEIGAAAILSHLGLETDKSFKNSAAYIQSWLQVLKNDNKFIVSAASRAEKAVNFIIYGTKEN